MRFESSSPAYTGVIAIVAIVTVFWITSPQLPFTSDAYSHQQIPQENLVPQTTQKINQAGQAFLAPSDFSDSYLNSQFAPPWDVFHGDKALFDVVPENVTSNNQSIKVRFLHDTNNRAQLTYDTVYVRKAQSTEWKPYTVTSRATSAYRNFRDGFAWVDIPTTELAVGDNYIAAYICTDIVTVNGGSRPACGCTAPNLNSCGKWNLQRVTATGIYQPAVDSTPPTVTITLPSGSTTTPDTTPLIQFIATDNIDTSLAYTLYANNSAVASGNAANNTTTNATSSALSNGDYQIYVAVTDDAGNSANSSAISLRIQNNDSSAPTAPGNLRLITKGASYVQMQWDASTDSGGSQLQLYVVQRNGVAVANISAQFTNYTDQGLTPSTLYNYTVLAEDGARNQGSSSNVLQVTTSAAATNDSVPPTTSILEPLAGATIADNTPSINFTASDNLQANLSYVVYIDGTQIATGVIASGTSLNVTSSQILSSGTHTAVSSVTDGINSWVNSSPRSFTVDTQPPSIVAGSNKTISGSISSSSAGIEIGTVDVATCRVSTTSQSYTNMIPFDTTNKLGAHSTILTGLSPTTVVTAYILCADSVNNLAPLATVTFTTTAAAQLPNPPTTVNAAALSSSSINVSWSSTNALSYAVSRSTSSTGTYTVITGAGTTNTFFVDTGLSASTTYYYKVLSMDSVGNSTWSNAVSATTPAGCSPESDPQFCSRLGATCGTKTGTDSCGLTRTVTSCGTCSGGQSCAANICVANTVSCTQASHIGQTCTTGVTTTDPYRCVNTVCTWYCGLPNSIGSVCPASYSLWTSSFDCQGSGGTCRILPAAPTGLTVLNRILLQANLSWSGTSANTGYRLYRATSAAGPYNLVASPTLTFFTENVAAAGTYYYRLAGWNSAGESANASLTVTYNTTDVFPPLQSNAGATSVTKTSAVISVATNEPCTCRWDPSNVAYAAMGFTMANTGGTAHTASLTGLSPTTTYTRYIRCIDTANNEQTTPSIVVFNTIPEPIVTSVSSSASNGWFTATSTIPIQVTFNRAVVVDTSSGVPTLTLETGTVDGVATYTTGSGTTTLTFAYSPQTGHTSSDLDYVSNSALALNGAQIYDQASGTSATAVTTLPAPGTSGSLSANKNLQVDTIAPAVTITNPASGVTITGPITVDAQATDASGVTQVQFSVGSNTIVDTVSPWSAQYDPTIPQITAFAVGPLLQKQLVQAVATDTAGNTASVSFYIWYDPGLA